MMQVARRTLLVAVLLLLASAGTASAECAWVVVDLHLFVVIRQDE